MSAATKGKYKRSGVLLLAILCSVIVLSLWGSYNLKSFFSTDLAWLFMCAERFLEGGTYQNDFFEVNPPLSFLMYVPAVWLYQLTGWQPWIAIWNIFLFFSFLITILFFSLLKRTGLPKEKVFLICAGGFYAQTLMMGDAFSQRDPFIFALLLPALLAQYLVTNGQDRPRILIVVASILGGIAVCLKPFYGLLPLLLYLHRLQKMRRIRSVVMAPDFLTMLGTGLFFFVLTLVLFPGYLSDVIPAVTAYYFTETNYAKVLPLIAVIAIYILTVGIVGMRLPHNKAAYALCEITLACLVIFVVQNKGFVYHLLPAFGFVSLALLIVLDEFWRRRLPRCKNTALVITMACFLLLQMPILARNVTANSAAVTHDAFIAAPLHKEIKTYAAGKSYAVFYFQMPFNLGFPYYIDARYASRFAAFWPLYSILSHNPEPSREREESAQPFVQMIAEDVARDKPALIAVPHYDENADQDGNPVLMRYLMTFPVFAEQGRHYQYLKTIAQDETVFLRLDERQENKKAVYDLFVRDDE